MPKMTTYFSTDVKIISWVLSGYNLAFTVLLITASGLPINFGEKTHIIGVVFFTSASVLSGLYHSIEMLITFRVVQGTWRHSLDEVSPKERSALLGFWGAFAELIAATGPALGGILSQSFNWDVILYINVSLVYSVLVVPTVRIMRSASHYELVKTM